MAATLYLLMGFPGSGKTTASKLIAELTGATHLWADQIRREQIIHPTYSSKENRILYESLNKITAQLLHRNQSVVFDTNFNFYHDRQNLRKIAAQNNAQCVLIWVQVPQPLAKQRAVDESHLHTTRVLGAMPEDQFARLAQNLQPPRPDEQPIIFDGTKLTRSYVAAQLKLDETH